MNPNEYRCAMCQEVFKKGWSDEEARAMAQNDWEAINAFSFGASIAHHAQRRSAETIERNKQEWWRSRVEAYGVPLPGWKVVEMYNEYRQWLRAMGYTD